VNEADYDRSRIYQVSLDPENENDARIIASKYIPSNSIVLDVGSACGDFGAFLHRNKNCEMHGMEFSSESIAVAKETGAYSTINRVDLNSFESAAFENYWKSFDVIVLLDVLEHVAQPNKAFYALKTFLREGGFFVISLPNVAFGDVKLQLLNDDFSYTETGILDETHLKFFTFKSIADFFSRQGVRILDCSVVVADVAGAHRVPSRVRSYVLKDPHSFVYQYVMKAEPSGLDRNALAQLNLDKLDIPWRQVNPRLRSIRRKKTLDAILPPGSRRREMVKQLLGLLRGS